MREEGIQGELRCHLEELASRELRALLQPKSPVASLTSKRGGFFILWGRRIGGKNESKQGEEEEEHASGDDDGSRTVPCHL